MSADRAWALRFLGVGSSAAVELGSASAVLEHGDAPLLMIDCGGEALSAYLKHFGEPPLALFITHAHLDHIGGMERLFFRLYFDEARRGRCRLYVPAPVVPLLQARLADYPGVLAEGGANWWDAFQLIPVSRGFWHAGRQFEVFPCRHHAPDTAFGLALRGCFVYSGDTRPIPEQLSRFPIETIAHDCGLHGNPSHTGLDDIEREYPHAWHERLALYHYGSAADGAAMRARGFRVLDPGERLLLPVPAASTLPAIAEPPGRGL
jgi:glyoxylase-like metal-dependent hydrolase (beta-lactamase superfamily II)